MGRSLAEQLLRDPANRELLQHVGGLDVDVVEAAALAHDLGHPPFGHVAEETLDQLLVEGGVNDGVPDGYNGNAQSFRIVTKLSVRYSVDRESDRAGLNLTRATLNGILKYPWRRANQGAHHEKWGTYDAEEDDFIWTRADIGADDSSKSLEAALMDWADDITYAVHDVEDFFRAGLIPLDRLTSDVREQERFLQWAIDSRKISHGEADGFRHVLLRSFAIKPGVLEPFSGGRAGRAALRNLTSQLISRYVSRSLSLVSQRDRVELVIDAEIEREVRILKLLTWCYVIDRPSLITQRFGQRQLITSLFRTFCEAAVSRGDRAVFPISFQEALEYAEGDSKSIKRIVADLIASMSEAQAIAINQRLSGQSLGSAMDAYFQ